MNRREFIIQSMLLALCNNSFSNIIKNENNELNPIRKTIHETHDTIPAVGMGTWLTFDVGHNTKIF